MAKRKTIRVDDLKAKVNDMLANSTCNADQRMGMIGVLTEFLHETGNYHGYTYLWKENVPQGHLPGVNPGEEDHQDRFANTDDSRRRYI